MLRRLVFWLVGLALFGLVLIVVVNLLILVRGGGSVEAGRAAGAPVAQAALVLGAEVEEDGELSPMLRDRVAMGAQLYNRARVKKIIVSGDHARDDYDEVNAMLRELLRLGVPSRDIFTDHAGFDTWDSVVRARKVFKARSVLVVSQDFHLPRAVWLAKKADLKATGVAAGFSSYGGERKSSSRREWLARPKAALDVLTDADPRLLGDPIPISGDGRRSRG